MEPVSTPSYLQNRDLFVNYYLTEHLPETDAWNDIDQDALQETREEILELWEQQKTTAPQRNESQLEAKFIRPLFRKLGIHFEVEESVQADLRRPDYGFFRSEEAAQDAYDKRDEGGDFYANAIAVADAKRWGRSLDTSGEIQEDYANPSFQIDQYLRKTETRWGVVTTGKKWRLYYKPTSHQIDSYYEIDLPEILENGDLEDFKYFYLFFRHEAFIPDASGDTFLDDVQNQSHLFARDLGDDLHDNIYEAIRMLAEGFRQHPDNEIEEEDLDLVHDSSLIYLYRLIFILYAEAEGRELLDTDNTYYQRRFSINQLKQDVVEGLDSSETEYPVWDDKLWHRINNLFDLINEGSKAQGIPSDELQIPAYNGELFRTNPDEGDSPEAHFLAETKITDAHLARVIDLLTRRYDQENNEKVFVDYSSLNIRHLGSIYEGLLEYQLNIATEPLTVKDGEYEPANANDEVIVEEDEVYLTTDSGERKATGSYYTPEYVVEYIVDNTLGPLVDEIQQELIGEQYASEFAERVFELNILDPAMGSGHFLTNAVNYLAREIINAQARQIEQEGPESIDETRDIYWARRQVAQQCIYGVDVNPLATELAKVSLWLRTLAAEQPLAFLDHHLKTGNSLIGSDIEDVLSHSNPNTADGQLSLQESFVKRRQQALEHVTDQFQQLLSIDNESLEDIKEMEAVFKEVQEDPLYQQLIQMANVHTADEFGLDVPDNAYERMATALRDDNWEEFKNELKTEYKGSGETDWFNSAQSIATQQHFFHWELEFPIVFYGDDGERDDDAGFDAVIGNPPYVRMEIFKSLKEFLSSAYQTHSSRTDLYVYFVEKSVKLLRTSGEYGVIVSNKFLKAKYGEALRGYLSDNTNIKEIIDFGELPVFEASTMPMILIAAREQQQKNPFYAQLNRLDFDSLAQEVRREGYELDSEGFEGKDWRLVQKDVSTVMDKMDDKGQPLAKIEGNKIGYGIKTGLNEAFIITDDTRDQLIEADESSRDLIKPLVRGGDIQRYHIEEGGEWLIYTHHGVDIDQYPAIRNHLENYKEDLSNRALDQEWYELQQPEKKYIDFFEGSKIVYPIIALEPRFTIDDGPLYPNDKCFFIPGDDYYLLSVLNSKLMHFYLAQICSTFGDPTERGRLEFREQYLETVPIIDVSDSDVSDGPPKELAEKAQEMANMSEERNKLNLNLLDYLQPYNDGTKLTETGVYLPSPDVSDSPLSATTEDYEKLRLGEVSVGVDNDTDIVVSASARYKPDNDDEFDTDRWGYTETEFIEAFRITDISEREAKLIEAFVPVAASKSNGFADFRENATKSTSLLDRMKAITLPDTEDVSNDLDLYLQTMNHAKNLDEQIKKTDQRIDEMVYDLYGLSEDDIEVVENVIKN